MSKDEFLQHLKQEGFEASFSGSGIPTVYIESPADADRMISRVRAAKKAFGYNQSFGISFSHKKKPVEDGKTM